MAEARFHHYGVPTDKKSGNEFYIEAGKVWATSPDDNPFRIEFLRFDADSPMHEAVLNNTHAAFIVDDMDAALEGQNVIVPPFDATDTLQVAFIMDGDAVIEVMVER